MPDRQGIKATERLAPAYDRLIETWVRLPVPAANSRRRGYAHNRR